MTRGPKTGSLQQGSFASKLAQINVGETVMFEDEFVDGCGDPIKTATASERAVQTAMKRQASLAGRKFTTMRVVAVLSGMKGNDSHRGDSPNGRGRRMTIRVSRHQSDYLFALAASKTITRSRPTEDALERAGYITRDMNGKPALTAKGKAFVGAIS